MTRLGDYVRWHHMQVDTDDIDPVYPVYRWLIRAAGLSKEQAAWLVLLHVNYYHMGSALAAFERCAEPGPPSREMLFMPTGTERRGHRDWRQMERHWLALLGKFEEYGGAYEWITAGGTDWRGLNEHLMNVTGNGRWAAYKLAEMSQKILGVATEVADAGHAHSSGPRKGLNDLVPEVRGLVGNSPDVIELLDRETEGLATLLGETDIGQVETSLCDFHSLVKGGYYLGHDIDAMQEQLRKLPCDLTQAAFISRAQALPNGYLGELHGWTGVDRERNRVYRQTGEIVVR